MSVVSCTSSCGKNSDSDVYIKNNGNKMESAKIRIGVNSKTFAVTVADNNSARAFLELLPLTVNMIELNGNEKYYDLSQSLPVNASNPALFGTEI